jgi:hypothetical protein
MQKKAHTPKDKGVERASKFSLIVIYHLTCTSLPKWYEIM